MHNIQMVFVLIFYAGRPWVTGFWNNFTHNVFRSLCTRYTSIALFRWPIFYLVVGGDWLSFHHRQQQTTVWRRITYVYSTHIRYNLPARFISASHPCPRGRVYDWYRVIVLVSVLMVCTRTKRRCASFCKCRYLYSHLPVIDVFRLLNILLLQTPCRTVSTTRLLRSYRRLTWLLKYVFSVIIRFV